MKKSFLIGCVITLVSIALMLYFSDQQIPSWSYKIKGMIIYTLATLLGGFGFQFFIEQLKK